MLYEIRFGTDGIGLPFGNVFADDMAEARELAAEKLRAENYQIQADEVLFTVHGHEKWTILRLEASLYAQRIDDVRENRPELMSAGSEPSLPWITTTANEAAALVAVVGNEIHERTERLVNDVSPGNRPVAVPGLTSDQVVQDVTHSLIERPVPEPDTSDTSQEMIDRIGQGDVYDDAPEFNRSLGLDEFNADGYARRFIEALSNSVPDLNEALRDEIPYEGDGFDPLSDR